ncbi:hypothetical protein [Streptacidiphilus carbonis]|jgi:hypothetical protein|nr:hypothetical protein [Streptacidiphilus carbonis]
MNDLRIALSATSAEKMVDSAELSVSLKLEGPRPVLLENIDD